MSKSIAELLEESRKLREKSRRLRQGLKKDLPQSIEALGEAIADAHKVIDSIKATLQPVATYSGRFPASPAGQYCR
jgi:hypothetical protein